MAKAPSWKEVDRLVSEQKMEAASQVVEKLRIAARAANNDEELARALVKEVQLRTSLHGAETAVRFLKDEKWPAALLPRLTLDLFYASALTNYLATYSWEIRNRERVEAKGTVDLKSWTADQIANEARKSYEEVWRHRAELGERPVSALGEYVTPNDYPKEIRGTLRDAVSYLAVNLLGDTSMWTPEESNQVFRLDFQSLMTGHPNKDSRLDDPAVHPLTRIAFVLDDLENWHTQQKQPEAALEARMERLRRLRASFTDKKERGAIEKDLDSRLPGIRKMPWWSSGMAQLADWARDDGDLVRARRIAAEGDKAFADSPGGRRCHYLIAAIELPDVSLLSMTSDGPRKRSIEVFHKNVPVIYFRAYSVDLQKRIQTAGDENLLPGYDEWHNLLHKGVKPVAEWSEQLPATLDYKQHKTFVTPPMTDKGLYVIVASVRKDFADEKNRIAAVNFIVTDLVIVVRQEGGGPIRAMVLDGETGQPVTGAEVLLYQYDYQKRQHEIEKQAAGDDGAATFSPERRWDRSYFLLAKKGGDIAMDSQSLYFYRTGAPEDGAASFVYTDRSIYRPLQTIKWKVVGYRGRADKADFHVVADTDVTVKLFDGNHDEVATTTLKTNAFGSVAGEFAIPAGKLLGGWQIESSLNGSASFRVEEYKRPTFEVKLDDPKGALRLNKEVTVSGEAKYYFGLPVAGGAARWRVTREAVFPWWWGYWFQVQRRGAETIASGAIKVEKDGRFHFTFTPAADERLAKTASQKSLTYRYSTTVDLTDEGGETRSAERGYRLGFVSVAAALSSDDGFFLEGKPAALTITRTNLDGVPRPGKGNYRILALQQPDKAVPPADLPVHQPDVTEDGAGDAKALQTPGDKLRARWSNDYSPLAEMSRWGDGAEKARGEVSHDDKGVAQVTLPKLSAGAYRIRYETTDDFGTKYENWKDLIVAGAHTPLALPAILIPQSSSVSSGGTARFLATSGIAGQTLFFEIFRDGKLVERRRISAEGNSLVEIPVKETDRGGFAVSLFAVRDHQFMRFDDSVLVPWDDKVLSLAFATFRDKMRPGEKETFRVTVKGANGHAVEKGAAELLAYMYDRSLDFFATHTPPSPISLFPSHAGAESARASVAMEAFQIISNKDFVELPDYKAPHGDELKFYERYGIGGMGNLGTIGRGAGGPGGGYGRGVAQPSMPMAMAAPAPRMKRAETTTADAEAQAEGLAAVGGKGKDGGGGAGAQQPAGEPPRSNFAETAFFLPQLLTDDKGQAVIEFKVPDSVTSWNLWVHAITKDLHSGSIKKEARSVKELMVRPYLPRFFREGDRADLKVVVNNASDKALEGDLTLEIFDPETKENLLPLFGVTNRVQHFTAQPNGGTNLTFPVTAPRRVGTVAFQVTAKAGQWSDGELRPLPILPGRMHLVQSRFVTLHDAEKREMKFDDLAKTDDPTRTNEQLVVTLDAQLFYTVLKALPYLVEYPYECTEQTLNRFISTGIVTSLYSQYPAVAKMAAGFAKRETRLESFDAADPNRKMTLEESPWLAESRGNDGPGASKSIINVLDPKIAHAQRDEALAKLEKAQAGSGGFPWFAGGPPSPYMTLYLLYGFAKAAEFKVYVPKQMVARAWGYLSAHFREDYQGRMMKKGGGVEFLTFLNYVASSYSDTGANGDALSATERKTILDYSFKHWKQHSPYLKGLLALTLNRMGRQKDAQLVFASVMDSAKTLPDQGTFWSPEDRSWLWYNDTIESHAFALRTLMELSPGDKRADGMVLWLFINKKLNHWKSTRATAEVVYSLVKYLQREKALGVREEAVVSVGKTQSRFVFEPDQYQGKSQMVVAGDKMDDKADSVITVEKQTKGFMFASATWHFSTEKLPAEERGDFFSVTRRYFKRDNTGKEIVLKPLAEGAVLSPGDEVEVQLSLRTKHEAEYVHLRDPRAAGLEPEAAVSQYKYDLGIGWYEEVRDSGTNFFFESLPAGEYTFKYRLRANLGGVFKVSPATVQSMYAPEFTAYSAGNILKIGAAK